MLLACYIMKNKDIFISLTGRNLKGLFEGEKFDVKVYGETSSRDG